MQLNIKKHHFPFFAQNANVLINAITFMARTRTKENLVAVLDPPIGSAEVDEIALAATTDPDVFHVGQKAGLNTPFNETQVWKLRMKKGAGSFNDLIESDIVECYMIVDYTVSQPGGVVQGLQFVRLTSLAGSLAYNSATAGEC